MAAIEKEPVNDVPVNDATFKEAMGRLKYILDLIKGKENLRNRLNAILKPEQLQTSTNITPEQANMIIDAYWFAGQYPSLYKPLKDLANDLMLTCLSLKGYGIEESIKLVGAIEQSQYFKSMIGSVGDQRHKMPAFKKTETKQ